MAEISALTPSPPGIGDPSLSSAPSSPHTLSSLPPSESPKQALIPKSALYGDHAMGTSSSPTPPPRASSFAAAVAVSVPEAAPPSIPTEPVVSQPAEGTMASSEGTRGLEGTETTARYGEVAVDPGKETQQQQKDPAHSPDVNPSPNLYPSVHVNPTSANPTPGEVQPPTEPPAQGAAAAPSITPTPPSSKDTDSTQTPVSASAPSAGSQIVPQTAAAVVPTQVQPPQPPPQDARPQAVASASASPSPSTTSKPPPAPAPKPASPATLCASKRALEPPGTPPRTEPPTLVVQESGPMLPLPSSTRPAPDTLSYLESASLMSGTLESLSGLGEDGSSVGSDSEINGTSLRRTDKYGFLGGTQYSEGSEKELKVEVARQREMKWLDMFNHWDKWINRRFQKVKLRCRKGIPSSLRAKAWQLLSNSKELLDSNPGKFEELEREQGDPKWLDIIEKDLHRQFPFHEMFAARGGHGQQDLYRILKAYTVYRPDEGYCQAQAPVAAVLLMHMPAEQAFWCLVQICERYLPGYYSAGLEAIQLDGEIFFSLLRRVCPMAYRHLKKFKIDPILYMTEWFMCIFSRTLPWSCVLRVWDIFFCEGVKVVFRVGLVLLKQMLGSVDKLRELQGMYETMERLRNIPPESIREDTLIQELISLPVTEALIERECSIQVRKWRESRGELTHQPGRRLHGTRAIYEQKRRATSISSGGSLSFLGAPVPPPGPLRASSSLLSLPGFRKSKAPFYSQPKKGSLTGPLGLDTVSLHEFSTGGSPTHSGGRKQVPHRPSPLVTSSTQPASQASASATLDNQNLATLPPTPTRTLAPSPKVVAEKVTATIPSPTANNAPLPPLPDPGAKPAAAAGGVAAAAAAPTTAAVASSGGVEEGKKKKKSKEDKRRGKEEEKQKAREKKEKEKAEKERQKKEKERAEKEKKKSGKKKDKAVGGGGEAEEKNGTA